MDASALATRLRTETATPHPSPEKIMQIGLGFWGSKTLLSAIELGLFTDLAGRSRNCAEIEKRLGLHPRASRDFLDALVALGFLERNGGRYANTAESDLFLDRAKPSYVGGMLEMANQRLFVYWNRLTEGLRTGEPQNEVRDGKPDIFEALYASPEALNGFLKGMTGLSRGANLAIARALPWKDYATFVDVGTAQGDLAVQIALANPHLMGVGFDLEPVRPVFEDYAAQTKTSDRLSFAGGDFFEDALPAADVVLMGHILHDWDLATKKTLIEKAYDALPPGGALVVYETLIDDDRSKNVFGLLMSLNMLIETKGGFDYTGADCRGWMAEAGFRDTRVEPLAGPDSMVVAIK